MQSWLEELRKIKLEDQVFLVYDAHGSSKKIERKSEKTASLGGKERKKEKEEEGEEVQGRLKP